MVHATSSPDVTHGHREKRRSNFRVPLGLIECVNGQNGTRIEKSLAFRAGVRREYVPRRRLRICLLEDIVSFRYSSHVEVYLGAD